MSARVGERSAKESFRRLLKRSRYRFSLATQKDNGVTLANMARPDSACLEDDQLQDFSAYPFFLPRLFSSGTALYCPMVDSRIDILFIQRAILSLIHAPGGET